MVETLGFPSNVPFPFSFQRHRQQQMIRCGWAVAEPARLSLYDVLRVKQTASPVEIKAAYRRLAKVYHPDATPAAADARDFILIHSAYQTLSDPSARSLYDLSFSFSFTSPSPSSSSPFPPPTRRWETDQCW